MKEVYVLKKPVEFGKLVITELTIEREAKGKFWRLAQKPMAVKADMDNIGGGEVTTYVTQGEAEIALMQAMTGQPLEVIDELGVDDFDHLFGCAKDMLGNFAQAQHLSKLAV